MIALLILGVTWFICSTAEKVDGTVNVADHDGFAFLGKFCFQDIPNPEGDILLASGTIDITLTNVDTAESSLYSLVFYDDQPDAWPLMHKKSKNIGLNCKTKSRGGFATRTVPVSTLKQNDPWKTGIDASEHSIPRWWRVYLVNCDELDYGRKGEALTDIKYSVHFKQVDHNPMMIEVGTNDQGLNTMYGIYLGIFVILMALQSSAYYLYTTQKQYIHQVIKLLTATIGLELFSVVFHFTNWITFAKSGYHNGFCVIMAMLFEISASCVFTLLLLSLAQGWTISHFKVLYPKLMSGSIIVMSIVQFALYLWSLYGLDEEETVYIYNSTPERIYGSLFIVFGAIFVALCLWSYKNEESRTKKRFYILLCVAFSYWFTWPLIRIFAGDAVVSYERDITIKSVSMTVKFFAYLSMMLLLCPIWARKFFDLSIDQAASIKNSMSMKTSVVQLL